MTEKLKKKLSSLIGEVEYSASTAAILEQLDDSLDELVDRHASLLWNETPIVDRMTNLMTLGEDPGTLGIVKSIQTLKDLFFERRHACRPSTLEHRRATPRQYHVTRCPCVGLAVILVR